jgi:hypothetical protein
MVERPPLYATWATSTAYLLAMMTGGTMMKTFSSSWCQILVRQPTTFLPWPYCCQPSCCHRHCHPCQGRWRQGQVDVAIKDLWPFLLGMTMMATNKNIDNDDVMTQIQATARPPSLSPPKPDARGAIVTTLIAMTTTMHAAVAAQIKGETTRALKIIGGTMRGTGNRHHNTTPHDNQQTEGTTRGGAAS